VPDWPQTLHTSTKGEGHDARPDAEFFRWGAAGARCGVDGCGDAAGGAGGVGQRHAASIDQDGWEVGEVLSPGDDGVGGEPVVGGAGAEVAGGAESSRHAGSIAPAAGAGATSGRAHGGYGDGVGFDGDEDVAEGVCAVEVVGEEPGWGYASQCVALAL